MTLIRIQQLIRKQEDIADAYDTVFTINVCNQNRIQFSSCTSYGESPWARLSRYVPTTGVFTKVGTCYKVATLHLKMSVTCPHGLSISRQSMHVISPSARSCRALLRSQEPFKRLDFYLRQAVLWQQTNYWCVDIDFIWLLVQCTIIGMFVKYTCCGSLGLGSGLRSLFTLSLIEFLVFCGVLCWGYVPCRHERRGKGSWF